MKESDIFFRIARIFRSGYAVLILGGRFNSTGSLIHRFNNHTHARNFTRYLFSQTRAHPQNHLTPRNIVVFYPRGERSVAEPLINPADQLKGFLAERFPKWNAEKALCDDGAFVSFALRAPDGHVVTNMVRSGAKGHPYLDFAYIGFLRGNQRDIDTASRLIGDAQTMTLFDEVEPCARTMHADHVIQNLVSKHLGGDPVLTVSHRDQLDHNQTYHLHRLLRMAA